MDDFNLDIPSMEAAADAAIDAALAQVRTAMPARVVRFDEKLQTATVQPQIHQVLANGSSAPYPLIQDVPVQFPRGGPFVMTFPVEPGDECLLVILDRCMDGWFVSGRDGPPLDYRLHDPSDATAIVGISSQPNVITGFATDAVVVRTIDGAAYLKIDKSGNLEMDGSMLTVKCPTVFEKMLTYQAGLAGSGGGVGTKISGDIDHSGGTIKSASTIQDGHHHIDSVGGPTGDPI